MFPHTFASINKEIEGKEYALQYTKRGWRCISWSPHYMMTKWANTKEQAILDGDKRIEEFYNKLT